MIERETESCTSPKFKAAEAAAFLILSNARKAAEEIATQAMNTLDVQKKASFAQANLAYVQDLGKCTDTACSLRAKSAYDGLVDWLNYQSGLDLKIIQDKEAMEKQAAQDEYNVAVRRAINLYCKQFKVSGKEGNTIFSGDVCLGTAFIITAVPESPAIKFPVQFLPSADSTGTWSYTFSYGSVSSGAKGNYTINALSSNNPVILFYGSQTVTAPKATASGAGVVQLNLAVISNKSCTSE